MNKKKIVPPPIQLPKYSDEKKETKETFTPIYREDFKPDVKQETTTNPPSKIEISTEEEKRDDELLPVFD